MRSVSIAAGTAGAPHGGGGFGASSGLAARSVNANPGVGAPLPVHGIAAARARPFDARQTALQSLRADGLKVREQDGGTLTPEHRAALQARLDRIVQDNRMTRFSGGDRRR
jgi:hypothetical protein